MVGEKSSMLYPKAKHQFPILNGLHPMKTPALAAAQDKQTSLQAHKIPKWEQQPLWLTAAECKCKLADFSALDCLC